MLIACIRESRCPGCMVKSKDRSRNMSWPQRIALDTRTAILEGSSAEMKTKGIRPIYPFWSRFVRTNVHRWFWPDLLHQIHKGLFTHVLEWSISLAGHKEVDARFITLPKFPHLRHFSSGLSGVSQWTENESKMIM